jgi:glutamate carboxypeptidase
MPAGSHGIEQEILDWLGGQRGPMLALLETLVNTDSGSYDKAGVDAVGNHIRTFLGEHGIATEVTPDQKFGDAITASIGHNGNRPILLMGHRDTVFPKGEPERRPFKIEGDRAYGPGIADMKAGLVMNCFVLAAIKQFGEAPAPLMALFTGDEEIGSPFSRPIIEAHARAARVCFNSEPGRARGAAVTGRGGCADSGFASATGTPTICAVGPVGGRAHTPDEYLEIETLMPRAQALALAVLRIGSRAY